MNSSTGFYFYYVLRTTVAQHSKPLCVIATVVNYSCNNTKTVTLYKATVFINTIKYNYSSDDSNVFTPNRSWKISCKNGNIKVETS